MKIFIFGIGEISSVFMEMIKNNKDVEVVGVYHRDINKAERFADKYRIENSFDSVERALSCDFDIVYNALPNSLHYSTSLQAIQASKHVLVEKPITSNLEELQKLIRSADLHGVKIFEVNRINYNEIAIKIKSILPSIYPVRMTQVNYCKVSRKYKQYLEGDRPNVFSLDYSGGALYDLGVYGTHLAVFLYGVPNNISYHCVKLDSGVDGCGCLTLEYCDHLVIINISKISNGNSFVEIQGEGGTIVSNHPPTLMNDFIIRNSIENKLFSAQPLNGSFKNFIESSLSIIEEKDEVEYRKLLEQSLNVMDVLKKARDDVSITFPSDSLVF